MDAFLRSPYTKTLCCYLALVMAGLIPGPMEARASFISPQPKEMSKLDPESMEALRVALENELIVEKLSELGLSSEEVNHRIEQLSPEERQIVLEELKTVQIGGTPKGILAAILVIWWVMGPIIAFFVPFFGGETNGVRG